MAKMRLNILGIGLFLILTGIYLFPVGTESIMYAALVFFGASQETLDMFFKASLITYIISIGLVILGFFIIYRFSSPKRAARVFKEFSPIHIRRRK